MSSFQGEKSRINQKQRTHGILPTQMQAYVSLKICCISDVKVFEWVKNILQE